MQKHILVAEDEGLVAMLLEDLLTDAGYRVTVAANGEKALEAWHRDRADAVLTDVAMPKMNGVQLVRRLREIEAALPVLVMTGYADLSLGIEQLQADAPERTAILEKPADLSRIEREMKRLLA